MRDFQILFDHGEPAEFPDPAFAPYGEIGFPPAPPDRPWIFANFVQTLDGIVSLLGAESSGSDISQSPEDRWLMDLLRAHADAVLIGMGTLRAETALGRPGPRGPVFRIADPPSASCGRNCSAGPNEIFFSPARMIFSSTAMRRSTATRSKAFCSPPPTPRKNLLRNCGTPRGCA